MCKESGFTGFYAHIWEHEVASKEARLHYLRVNHGLKVYSTLGDELVLPVVPDEVNWVDERLGLPQSTPEFQRCIVRPAKFNNKLRLGYGHCEEHGNFVIFLM